MRALVTKDIFTMSRIITKMNIKDELRDIFSDRTDFDSENANLNLGIDTILMLMSKISDKSTEKEIYVFLADITEKTPADIEMGDPLLLIEELTSDDGAKQWKDFFTKVSRLIMRPSSLSSKDTE